MKLILKGILTGEDAKLAVEHGVDAIIVSNHGGRQLDSVMPAVRYIFDLINLGNSLELMSSSKLCK